MTRIVGTLMPQLTVLGKEYGFTVWPDLYPQGAWDYTHATDYIYGHLAIEGIEQGIRTAGACDIEGLGYERPLALTTSYFKETPARLLNPEIPVVHRVERLLSGILRDYIQVNEIY